MAILAFATARLANIARKAKWPGPRASLEFRATEFAGEAGELMDGIKKLIRARNGTAGNGAKTEEAILQNIREEIGDVLVTLDLLALELGVSLGESFVMKFNMTSEKIGNPVRIEPRLHMDGLDHYEVVDLDEVA